MARRDGAPAEDPHGGSSRSEAEASPDHQHWFEPVAEHLGSAYLRYSFTKGTVQEVEFLVRELGLQPGMRVLDVGCGPGRHAHELARRGLAVHGIDISERFVELARADAPAGATFERMDARDLAFEAEFDLVICLCQGAFGLMTANDDDERVLSGMASALRPGGRLALSAFNAYFAVKYFDGEGEGRSTFDADTGVNHEHTEVRSETGASKTVDLWTGCYTPRELRVLCRAAGLVVESVNSVEPGAYALATPTVETAEFLVVARRA
ncbi:MAG: methyltransferase domain-containing protein [Actinobacteria bacterium]|nr:methyltransferase domain-containing protein [Actinomycetota bacterium]